MTDWGGFSLPAPEPGAGEFVSIDRSLRASAHTGVAIPIVRTVWAAFTPSAILFCRSNALALADIVGDFDE